MIQAKAAHPQPAAQKINECKGPKIANMRVILNRGTAGIHPNGITLSGLELFHPLRKRVVEAQGHVWKGETPSYQTRRGGRWQRKNTHIE
jgi:hypothetical protein